VLLAAVLSVIMITWNRGRRIYGERSDTLAPSVGTFLAELPSKVVARIPGCSIFLTGRLTGIPLSLVHYVGRIRVLPEHVMLLTLDVVHVPHANDDAMVFEPLGDGVPAPDDRARLHGRHVRRAAARARDRALPPCPSTSRW